MINTITIDGVAHHREKDPSNFDKLILSHVDEYQIEKYAEWNLGLEDPDNFECDCSIDDYPLSSMLDHLKENGYVIFKPETILESQRLKAVKELFQF